MLHVDAGGQILAANARANEFLRAADGISNQDGILRTGRTEDVTKLRQLISVAGPTADRATTEIGGVLNIRRASGRRPLQMLVTPVRGSRERLGEQRPRATVFIADPDMALDRNEERLRRLYGLTHAEARLVQAFAHHGSIEQAAAAAGIALSTARAYLKRIFVKAGVTRQTELLRLILCGPAALRSIGVCRQPRI